MPDDITAIRNNVDEMITRIPELVAGAVPVTGTSDATLLSKVDDMITLLEIIAGELDT